VHKPYYVNLFKLGGLCTFLNINMFCILPHRLFRIFLITHGEYLPKALTRVFCNGHAVCLCVSYDVGTRFLNAMLWILGCKWSVTASCHGLGKSHNKNPVWHLEMRIWHSKQLFCLPWSVHTNRTETADAFCGPHIAILMGIVSRLQTRSVLPPHQIAGTLPKTSRNTRTTLVILHMSPLKRRHVFW